MGPLGDFHEQLPQVCLSPRHSTARHRSTARPHSVGVGRALYTPLTSESCYTRLPMMPSMLLD